MLILNDKTISTALSFEEVLSTVEEAMLLYDSESYIMPDRMHLDMDKNTLLLMPSAAGEYLGTKLVSFFPGNANKALPSIMGTMLLNDGKTGKPLAMLDATSLTAMRTGAVGGVALRYLSQENITSLGLIGLGVQGLHQALFACTARKIKTIFLLYRNADKIKAFKQTMRSFFPGVKIKICTSVEELTKNSKAIITATNSYDPVLPEDPSLLKDKTIIAVGSYKPSMREMPNALYPLLNEIYVDTLLAKKESGDLLFPLENGFIHENKIKTLGQRIANHQPPPGDTNFFKSVGMALFDLITAKAIYEKAKAKGLGTKVNLTKNV